MASPEWNSSDADSFGRGGELITPSDTARFDHISKAVVVTDITAGSDLSVVTANGSTIPFVGVSAGFIVPYRVVGVNATGTTCTVYTID